MCSLAYRLYCIQVVSLALHAVRLHCTTHEHFRVFFRPLFSFYPAFKIHHNNGIMFMYMYMLWYLVCLWWKDLQPLKFHCLLLATYCSFLVFNLFVLRCCVHNYLSCTLYECCIVRVVRMRFSHCTFHVRMHKVTYAEIAHPAAIFAR